MSFIVRPSWIVRIASDAAGSEMIVRISGTVIDWLSMNLPDMMLSSRSCRRVYQ